MASFGEVNSFVTKFLSLWHTGRDACLQIETQSGKAFANLRVGLGEHPHHQQHHRKESPSKQRRREKRAAERLATAEEAKATSNENADEAEHESLDLIDAIEKVAESEQVEGTANEGIAATAFEVVDEVCNDKTYENKQDKSEEDLEPEKVTELFDATFEEGKVITNPDEVILEVRPQYCAFSAQDLASRLKQMGLELVCLPWIANTGRHFYTAGFKITNRSYEAFKTRGDSGAMPKGFYRVETSWKYN